MFDVREFDSGDVFENVSIRVLVLGRFRRCELGLSGSFVGTNVSRRCRQLSINSVSDLALSPEKCGRISVPNN